MAYYKRDIEDELIRWKNDSERQPLLIRGARQVGKSSVVRNFSSQFKSYVEVNFEQDSDVKSIFEGNLRPKTICEQLSILYETPIIPGETLLFFDEDQITSAMEPAYVGKIMTANAIRPRTIEFTLNLKL